MNAVQADPLAESRELPQLTNKETRYHLIVLGAKAALKITALFSVAALIAFISGFALIWSAFALNSLLPLVAIPMGLMLLGSVASSPIKNLVQSIFDDWKQYQIKG